jgi:hypothetical protein
LYDILENYIPHIWATVFRGQVSAYIHFVKKWVGLNFGCFFTNSSGHPSGGGGVAANDDVVLSMLLMLRLLLYLVVLCSSFVDRRGSVPHSCRFRRMVRPSR